MEGVVGAPISDGLPVPYLAPETREEMFRAFYRIAESRLMKGPDRAAWGGKPIFNPEEEQKLLAFLSSCTDAEFLAFTESFLEDCGDSRRSVNGTRLVFAPSFMDDLRGGLRDTHEPLDPDFLRDQVRDYRRVLAAYRETIPSFGVPLEEEDEKNLRQVVKKMWELTNHLIAMRDHTKSSGQSDLCVALIYKIQKLLAIPQTFAFAQMVLSALFELTERFPMVESMYHFEFAERFAPYFATLQQCLQTRADVVRVAEG